MSTCATDRSSSALRTAVGLLAVIWCGVAPAEELEPRGEVTLETRFYALPDDFSDDDLSSFFDQYHGFWVKERRPPYFLSLAHVDLGLARDDDTYLVRFERWSPHWLNERGELEIHYGGLDLDLDYRRYRSDDRFCRLEGRSS